MFKFWTLCIFEPPLRGLETTYDVHLGLIGKHVVDFLLVWIELFSLGVTAEAPRVKTDRKSVISLQCRQFDSKFQVEGVTKLTPTTLVDLKFSWLKSATFTVTMIIVYTLCSKKSDAKIQITITMAHLIRINYRLNSFNYHLSGTKVANFNKFHHIVSEKQLFKKWNSKTEFSNMENTD